MNNLEKQISEVKNSILFEMVNNPFVGKTFISVDIQPEYENAWSFNMYDYMEFISSIIDDTRVIFLYNGYETLGMISESNYKQWLLEYMDYSDEAYEVVDKIEFYDKGYAFFRYCMDSGIDHDDIVKLVNFMIRQDINDSRDIDWDDYRDEFGEDTIFELLEYADSMVYIPELVDYLKDKNNIVLTGGGANECLKEVEIALDALGKPYDLFSKYTY